MSEATKDVLARLDMNHDCADSDYMAECQACLIEKAVAANVAPLLEWAREARSHVISMTSDARLAKRLDALLAMWGTK